MWTMLDHIICGTIAYAHLIPASKYKNDTEITLNLYDFRHSCGYTENMSKDLFSAHNRVGRKVCEDLGVEFINIKQSWDRKQIRFNYKTSPPHLNDAVLRIVDELKDDSVRTVDESVGVAQDSTRTENNNQFSVSRGRHIIVHGNNNKKIHWFRIIASNIEETTSNRFVRTFPNKYLKEILKVAAGDLATGVTLLTERLFKLNKSACCAGIRLCGAPVLEGQN